VLMHLLIKLQLVVAQI